VVGVEERRRRGGRKIRVGVEREQVGRGEASLKKVSLVCLAGLVSPSFSFAELSSFSFFPSLESSEEKPDIIITRQRTFIYLFI